MSVELEPPEIVVPRTYREQYQAEVKIIGEIPPYDLGNITTDTQIWHVVFELIGNCAQNRGLDGSQGAKNITVTFEPGKVTVEDDFVYENPEPVLAKIIDIRDSGKPMTTRPPEKGPGGCGIFSSTKTLQGLGGNLDCYVKNGTIVAVETWNA